MAHQLLTSVYLCMCSFLLWLAPLLLLLLSIKLVVAKRSVRLPPSPWKLPLIGNLHQFGSHQTLNKLSKKHGPLMFLKLGQIPTLVVSSSEMAKEIMKTHDHIFASRPALKAARILHYGTIWRVLEADEKDNCDQSPQHEKGAIISCRKEEGGGSFDR
ncbi:putative cytochrome P450 [Dioscorea sansibarensis]